MLQVTCKAKPSCRDFDCFRPLELFHRKVVEASMAVTYPLLAKFTEDLLELFCYLQVFYLTWLVSFSL